MGHVRGDLIELVGRWPEISKALCETTEGKALGLMPEDWPDPSLDFVKGLFGTVGERTAKPGNLAAP